MITGSVYGGADVGIEAAIDVHGASVFCAGVAESSSSSNAEDKSLVTSGGRVLTVVVTHRDLKTAVSNAQSAAGAVNFTGKTYRSDIALKALRPRFVIRQTYVEYCRLRVDTREWCMGRRCLLAQKNFF